MIEQEERVVRPQGASSPETRALLLDIPVKPILENLREQVILAAQSGFNVLLLPFFQGGYPLFPSRVARDHKFPDIRPDLKKMPGLFFELIEAAEENSLSVYGYSQPLSVGDRRNQIYGPIILRSKKWGAMNKQGKFTPIGDSENNLFLCLNNPDVRRFCAELVVEFAESYPIGGAAVDIHSYPFQSAVPENTACYCEYCRKHVREEIQLDLQTLSPETEAAARRWKRWKEDRLFSFVYYISGRLRESRIGMPFFSVVPGTLPPQNPESADRKTTPGDWASQGIVTSLITRYPQKSPGDFTRRVRADLERIEDDSLLAPAIEAMSVQQLADYILHLRKLPIWGYFFSLSSPLTRKNTAQLAGVAFQEDSFDSLSDIYRAIRLFVEHLLHATRQHPALDSFLQVVIRYIEDIENVSVEATQGIIDDFRTVEQKYRSGDMDTAFLPPETLRYLSLIRKLMKTSILIARE